MGSPYDPDALTQGRLYYGVFDFVRGSATISGSSDISHLDRAVAVPLDPVWDLNDPEQSARINRLLYEVVRWGSYTYYVWSEEDESDYRP